jgi:hypothetical protein
LGAEGPVVVEPRDTTVNLKAGDKEEFGLKKGLALLAFVFLVKINVL